MSDSQEASFTGPVADSGDASSSAVAPANSSATATGAAATPKEVFTQSLPVPEHKMGWIIGKAGVNINMLSKKSGANISVSDSTSLEFGIKWNYIQITGNGRAVDRAKKLILLRLERLDATGNDIRMQHAAAQQYHHQAHMGAVGGYQQQQGYGARAMGNNNNNGMGRGPRAGAVGGPRGGFHQGAGMDAAAHHE